MKRGSKLVPKEQVIDPRFIVACPQMLKYVVQGRNQLLWLRMHPSNFRFLFTGIDNLIGIRCVYDQKTQHALLAACS